MFQFLLAILALSFEPVHASEVHMSPFSSGSAETPANPGESGAKDNDGTLIDPRSPLYRSIRYAGKFHLMALHFPIAFLFGAALVKWYQMARGKGDEVAAVLLWFGALGAIGAAALGWMHAYDSVYFGGDVKLLFWHRWLGTGTAALALVVLLLRNKLGSKSLAAALTLCAGLVTGAAHFGSSLVHGTDFLKFSQ